LINQSKVSPISLIPDEKIFKHSRTRALRSVQNRAFITLPFSGSTIGVRIGSFPYNLDEAMVVLTRGTALSALEFSQVFITKDGDAGSQAVSPSGVRVYTQLSIWNGTNLEEFCPGSSIPIQICEDLPSSFMESRTSSSLSDAWIAVILVLAVVVVVGVVGFLGYVISKEKQGKPLFLEEDHDEEPFPDEEPSMKKEAEQAIIEGLPLSLMAAPDDTERQAVLRGRSGHSSNNSSNMTLASDMQH
jgi:hypothetical protein